jgi:uncharacterized membrane protein
MIKYVLIVFALTQQGPSAQAVAEFRDYNQCVAIARQLVPQVQAQLGTLQVTAVCQERTEV